MGPVLHINWSLVGGMNFKHQKKTMLIDAANILKRAYFH